jgi:type VI secretion system protein ImpA
MDTPPTMQAIEGAFRDVSLEDLKATADAVRAAAEQVRAIEGAVTEKVGASNAASLDPLAKLLKEAGRAVDTRLAARGGGAAEGAAAGADGQAANGHALNGGAAPLSMTGELQSRDDVMRMLDKICEYYERAEPSSPVPLLLQRAKKLVPMTFMEIVQDLIPDGSSQAQLYRGRSE